MDNTIPYAERRNSNLPWGYWLEATGDRDPDRALRDEDGRYWPSVRHYLWTDRLGLGSIGPEECMHRELEFLLAVLVAFDRRIVPIEEAVEDLFHTWEQARFYRAWLAGLSLCIPSAPLLLTNYIPSEGQAIIVMLTSTRRKEDVPLAVGLPTLKPHQCLDPDSNTPERERIITELEAFATHLPYRFERTTIGDSVAIKLVGDGLGPNIPLRRTLWTMTFRDSYARDRFYIWLQYRIDRWAVWGEMGYRKGARALSEHFLQLQFADQQIDTPKR